MRLSTFPLMLLAVGCSMRPGWVHDLPQNSGLAAGTLSLPAGVWERNAQNRSPAVHRTHYSDARETIETRVDGTYTKVHMAAQVTDSSELLIAYREHGTWTPGGGRWILLQPREAASFEATSHVRNPRRGVDTRYPFPAPESIAFESVSPPAALLYLLDTNGPEVILLPASYERLGTIYSFGVFEGSEAPFDSSSAKFMHAKDTWLLRRFQPAHYALRKK